MIRRTFKKALLAAVLCSLPLGSLHAAIASMALSPTDFNIFSFADGQVFIELEGASLFQKLDTTAVNCNTSANNVYLPPSEVNSRALATLYLAIASKRDIRFWVTDVNVPVSTDTCRFHAVRIKPASTGF